MNYEKTAGEILAAVGGEKNISSLTHCITRLRFILADDTIPKDAEVKKIQGVIQVIRQGGQYQVVIGNAVGHVFAEMQKKKNFSDRTNEDMKMQAKGNLFSRLCGFIAGCMTPLLPAMLGCGMLKVILTLLTLFEVLNPSGSTASILSIAGDSFFYYLPIMLAYTTAQKMGTSPFLAMIVAAIMLHPNLSALFGAGNVSYFGLPVTEAVYSSSVLPILLMVPIMKYIEKFADKISPDVVKVFLKPLIVIFISLPLALVVIGPLGTIAGSYLAEGINLLYAKMGWLAIALLSAAMPFIVMTGMHYALLPLCTISLATFGYDAILIVTMFCYNLSLGSAALAVAVKTKNKDVRSTATASGFSAIIAGVTEPALYGVGLNYKTPLIAAICASGISGLYAGITHLVAYTMGSSPSALSLLQMIGENGMGNMINGVIAMLIALILSFVLCFLLYKPEVPVPIDEESNKNHKDEKIPGEVEVRSPLKGKTVPLSEVPDPVFSGRILGDGIAIPPEAKQVSANDILLTATSERR